MAKTVAPGEITIPQIDTFAANALPDPFDERDLEYRPRLQPLPAELDQRTGFSKRYVMRQVGSSCTGHALAAVINTVLSRGNGNGRRSQPPQAPHVSPYMLYHLARRYDEFAGEDDAGSSLRGALKGWFNHGVIPEDRWPSLDMDPVPDLDDEELLELGRQWPLGTFYRVNPFRLDDMQSAITELNAICASAVIHDGWVEPQIVRRNGEAMHVIARRVNAKQLGGHAFALVGYNEVGFLVQNSWGPDWGKGGFATLPYEDWLDSAYDAWVTRPGVPKTPFASGRTRTAAGTGGELVTAPAPDLKRLANYVVNLGNQGLLSTSGSFVSTPTQIDRAFGHMERWHDQWLAQDGAGRERHVLLYAHGGLNAEDQGLRSAQRNVNWWLNNRIYPLFFAWQSGPAETLMNELADKVKVRFPFGLGFDFMEALDRGVELLARQSFRWMWEEMKENARAASEPIGNRSEVVWPPTPAAQTAMARMPGASLTVLRLVEYVRQHQDAQVMVHLVGHSAGAIFHAALLQRLVEAGVPVASMALLAPALRVDDFEVQVLPHLGPNRTVRHFAVFNLSNQRELDDACGASGVDVYHKSLLYLVSRALEARPSGQSEAPLLGMERFFDRPPDSSSLRRRIEARGGASIFSPAALADNSRSDATSHGGFAGDSRTMTSVVMRALGRLTPAPETQYQPNAALIETEPAPPAATQPRQQDATPAMIAAEIHQPGDQPLAETAEPQTEQPTAPDEPARIDPEVAVAPRSGSAIIDVLLAQGWQAENPLSAGATQKPPTGTRN
jgi:acetyl esterase/lipase